jgi:hypothetical protein
MNHSAFSMGLEALEDRTLFSVPTMFQTIKPAQSPQPAASTHGPVAHAAVHRRVVRTANFVVAFYGLGGGGFGNEWLSTTADAVGQQTGSVVRKYQETQGNQALLDFFKSVDSNGDKTISTGEMANVHVRVLGYSFGGVQGSDFTRSLTQTRRPVLGYKLSAAMPVDRLVTIDPVNFTPLKHTDGPVGNVRSFVSFYELHSGSSTIQLTDRAGRPAGSMTLNDIINPVGGPLPSSAQSTQQTLVDFGAWAGRSVTRYINRRYYGTLSGSGVNHATMPWYLYTDVINAMQ